MDTLEAIIQEIDRYPEKFAQLVVWRARLAALDAKFKKSRAAEDEARAYLQGVTDGREQVQRELLVALGLRK